MGIASKLDFSSRNFENADANEVVWISPPNEHCIYGSYDPNNDLALDRYRLCLWRGEWAEAFSLETDEHTLPTSLEDYQASVWLTIALIALGLGFGFGSFRLLFSRESN